MKSFFLQILTWFSHFDILKRKKIKLRRILFRQSLVHESVKNVLPTNAELRKKKKTQSRNLHEKKTIRIVYAPDNKAYWVSENVFYCADLIDGEVDLENAKPIDTHDISKQEIERLLFILDNLRNE